MATDSRNDGRRTTDHQLRHSTSQLSKATPHHCRARHASLSLRSQTEKLGHNCIRVAMHSSYGSEIKRMEIELFPGGSIAAYLQRRADNTQPWPCRRLNWITRRSCLATKVAPLPRMAFANAEQGVPEARSHHALEPYSRSHHTLEHWENDHTRDRAARHTMPDR